MAPDIIRCSANTNNESIDNLFAASLHVSSLSNERFDILPNDQLNNVPEASLFSEFDFGFTNVNPHVASENMNKSGNIVGPVDLLSGDNRCESANVLPFIGHNVHPQLQHVVDNRLKDEVIYVCKSKHRKTRQEYKGWSYRGSHNVYYGQDRFESTVDFVNAIDDPATHLSQQLQRHQFDLFNNENSSNHSGYQNSGSLVTMNAPLGVHRQFSFSFQMNSELNTNVSCDSGSHLLRGVLQPHLSTGGAPSTLDQMRGQTDENKLQHLPINLQYSG
eukprot:Selendium_serpulae@DN5804_c0_g1_i1.p1